MTWWNERLPQFAEDMAKVGVDDAMIARMWAKEAPLGFRSPDQFTAFKAEMDQAFKQVGLMDAEVGLKGTSTTFYSENPSKRLGHHWDADPENLGDYDINITSPTMRARLDELGIAPSEKYGVFKTRDIESTFKPLDDFQKKWSGELGRDVNFVGYPKPVARDATEYILRARGATNSGDALRRSQILSVGGTPELQASSSITQGSLMQAIADNPVSMASYNRMQNAGGDLQFNFNLYSNFQAVGKTNSGARLIELDPIAIQREAKMFGYEPSQYAARVFTHEAGHLTDMSRNVWQNNRYSEYKAYRLEYLFENQKRPPLETRRMIWNEVNQDYPYLPVGKNPFGQ